MERQESVSSTNSFDLSRQISGELTETIPTRLSVVAPRPLADPMRFVATGRAPLIRSASEQLDRVQHSRTAPVTTKIVEDDCTDWQNNLDNWKSSRRKRQETVIERLTEVKRMEEADTGLRRRGKTFEEMVHDRNEKGGGRVSNGLLQVYTEESNDIGTLLTSKSPTSGSDTTRSDLGFNTGSDSGSEHSSDHQEVDDKLTTSRSSSVKNGPVVRQTATSDLSRSVLAQRLTDPSVSAAAASVNSGTQVSSSLQEDSGTEECTYDSAIREYIRFAEKTCSPVSAVRPVQSPTVSGSVQANSSVPLSRDPSSGVSGVHVFERRSVFEPEMATALYPYAIQKEDERRGRVEERNRPLVVSLSGGLRERIARLEETTASTATAAPPSVDGDDADPDTRGRLFRQKLAMFSSISESTRQSSSSLPGVPAGRGRTCSGPASGQSPAHEDEEGESVDVSSQLSATDLRLRFEQLAAAAESELAGYSAKPPRSAPPVHRGAATTSDNTVRRSLPPASLASSMSRLRRGGGGVSEGRAPSGVELKHSVLGMLAARSSHRQHVPPVVGQRESAGASSCPLPERTQDRDGLQSSWTDSGHDPADSLVGQMEEQILSQLEFSEKNQVAEEDPAMILDFTSTSSEACPPSEKPPPPPMTGLSEETATSERSSTDQMAVGSLRSPAEIRDDLQRRKHDFFNSTQPVITPDRPVSAATCVSPLSQHPSSNDTSRSLTSNGGAAGFDKATKGAKGTEGAEESGGDRCLPDSASGRLLSVDEELDRQEREIIEGLEREENWRLQQQAKYKNRLSRMPPAGRSSAEDEWWSQSQPSLSSLASPTISTLSPPLSTLSRASESVTESAGERRSQLLASSAHSRSNPSLQRVITESYVGGSSHQTYSQQRRSLLAPTGWSQPNSLHHKVVTPQLNLQRQHQQPKLRADVSRNTGDHWVVQEAEQRRVSDMHIRQVSKASSSDSSELHRAVNNGNNGPIFPGKTSLPGVSRQMVRFETNGTNSGSNEYRLAPQQEQIHSPPLAAYANHQHPQNYESTNGPAANSRLSRGIDSSSSMFGQPISRQEIAQPIYENTPAQLSACAPNWGTSSNSGSSVSNDFVGGAAALPPGGQGAHDERVLSVSGRTRCSHCSVELGRGAAMVIESLHLFYHIGCFKCCVCSVQLGNGSMGADVRVRNNKLHCHNCYSNDDGLKFSKV